VKVPRQVATCPRCKVYMVKHSMQTVDDPKHSPIQVQIYECPSCYKLAAEEIGSSSGAGEAA
jgi:transposase-like protein